MSEVIEPAVAPAPQARGNVETVTVACKLPNGLHLHVFEMEERSEQMFGGGVKSVKQARRLDETYTVKGSALDIARLSSSGEVGHLIVGGFGLTPGIPKAFWDRWLEQNKGTNLVTGGFVWALKNEADARRKAAESASLKSGLEPVDPTKPGMYVGRSGAVSSIQPGTTTG